MTGSGHFWQYFLLLLEGAGVTLKLSLVSILIGTLAGLFIGLGRIQRTPILSTPAYVVTEIIRSIPFLVLLFFIYYVLPLLLGANIPPYASAVIALSLYTTGYMAEVVRSGIAAVPRGQREAGAALGLRRRQVFALVIMPQALPIMVPPAIGVYISALKASSLTSAIGFVDLLGTGLDIRESLAGRGSSGVLLWVAAIYFVLCYTLSRLGGYVEHRGGTKSNSLRAQLR